MYALHTWAWNHGTYVIHKNTAQMRGADPLVPGGYSTFDPCGRRASSTLGFIIQRRPQAETLHDRCLEDPTSADHDIHIYLDTSSINFTRSSPRRPGHDVAGSHQPVRIPSSYVDPSQYPNRMRPQTATYPTDSPLHTIPPKSHDSSAPPMASSPPRTRRKAGA